MGNGRRAIVGRKARSGECGAPRLALLREEVPTQSVEERTKRGWIDRLAAQKSANVGREHHECGTLHGAIAHEPFEAVGHADKNLPQPLGRVHARASRGQVLRTVVQVTSKRRRRNQTPVEERRQPHPQPPLTKLREHDWNGAARYLHAQFVTFHDTRLAAAAYNAGPGRPRRWREGPGAIEPAAWAETIPFNETRDYVKKVLSNSVYYAAMLGSPVPTLKSRLESASPSSAWVRTIMY